MHRFFNHVVGWLPSALARGKYSLAVYWNAIITMGISVTSLMIATCYQATRVRCTCTWYGMSKGAGQASKMKAEGKRWLRNMPWACQDASANIKSSWDESVKVSQLAMIIDVLHKALSSSILSSHRLQVFKATSYAWECWLVWYHYWLVIEWPFITFHVHWLQNVH